MPSPNTPIKDKLWKAAVITSLTAVAYELAHRQAAAWRGYEAVGGEMLIWVLPLAVWAVRRTAADWLSEIRETLHGQTKER